MAAVAARRGDEMLDENQLAKDVKQLIREGREDRKRFEPTWQSNLAFAAGKFYLKWDRDQRRLVFPPELAGKDLYAPDVISEYRMTALGELSSDDDRPELLLVHDDETAEDFQAAVNRALGYGWDQEWDGDERLQVARRLCVDLGTSAVQCFFDPTVGPVVGEVPHVGGRPVYDPKEQGALFENGPNPQVQMKETRQGRITWRPLSSFNLVVPPGIPDEAEFPWECIVDSVALTKAVAEYGAAAAGLKEDTDIGNVLGLDTSSELTDGRGHGMNWQDGKPGRVRNQVWRFRYYERPSDEWPNGRVLVFLGNKMKLVSFSDRLPYQAPDGTYRSGIAYFHWQRVSGRFWSRALVEAMKDPQRAVWKRRTQTIEIIDRGMPFVLAEEGKAEQAIKSRRGVPIEVIPVPKSSSTAPPIIHPGVGPGEWMYRDIEALREDMEHATGMRGPRLGENPTNVNTYSQLALINENEQVKRAEIHRQHKQAIANLVEDSVYDMRTYWGAERQVMLAGDEDKIESEIFNATKIPPFFIVKVAKGAPKPRSQAAELKKIEQLWQAAIDAGAVTHNPDAWVRWLDESMAAGQPLDLPELPSNAQIEKARVENHLLLEGQTIQADYYDPPEIHVPEHREAEIQAQMSGDLAAAARIEQHIQSHLQVAAANAAQLAAIQPAPAPAPGQPSPTQQPPAPTP